MRLRDNIQKENYKILVVDDEQGIIDSLSIFLNKYYFKGMTDPLAAIELLKQEHFDLLILDFLMSPIHGDQVVEEIRKFNKDIYNPIFALSIKDFKGLEIAGANTDVYKVETGEYKKGQIITVEFNQTIPLAPDRYTISFGCTRFDENGNLQVFDRKYDIIIFEVTATRGCLGVIDLKTDIIVK